MTSQYRGWLDHPPGARRRSAPAHSSGHCRTQITARAMTTTPTKTARPRPTPPPAGPCCPTVHAAANAAQTRQHRQQRDQRQVEPALAEARHVKRCRRQHHRDDCRDRWTRPVGPHQSVRRGDDQQRKRQQQQHAPQPAPSSTIARRSKRGRRPRRARGPRGRTGSRASRRPAAPTRPDDLAPRTRRPRSPARCRRRRWPHQLI